ncbi:MAG: biotin/lipoyl-binding protein, partial [Armatimonadetes bacterium]|nr:biotin/lipoyl-binding protein [Armatimonadota bacterium]
MNKRIIAGIVVAAVVIVGAVLALRERGGEPENGRPEQATAKVQRGDLRVTVAASGVLEPLTTVEVKPRAGGEITRIYVEPGDYVHQGDLIAQLDPTQVDLQVAQAWAQV